MSEGENNIITAGRPTQELAILGLSRCAADCARIAQRNEVCHYHVRLRACLPSMLLTRRGRTGIGRKGEVIEDGMCTQRMRGRAREKERQRESKREGIRERQNTRTDI